MSLFTSRPSSGDPWFRIGRLEVSTVIAVVMAVVVSWMALVILPTSAYWLSYTPDAVAAGQVWRLLTWPLVNGMTLGSVLNLFCLWYFGTELERMIGRTRMVWLLLGIWASLTAASTVVGFALGGGTGLAGIDVIEFALLLLWIAEFPRRPFLFSIPAWVVGAVLVALQVAGLLAARSGGVLLSLLLAFGLVAVVARRVGLLGEYALDPRRAPSREAHLGSLRVHSSPTSSHPERVQRDGRRPIGKGWTTCSTESTSPASTDSPQASARNSCACVSAFGRAEGRRDGMGVPFLSRRRSKQALLARRCARRRWSDSPQPPSERSPHSPLRCT